MSKTALVTGSVGFLGRHMVRELESRGYQVDGIDIAARHRGVGNALNLFRSDEKVYDLVVHCAYHVGGRAGIDGVNTNFAKNLQLDAAMFEWAVRTKQKHVLYFSSCAAYPARYQTADAADCYSVHGKPFLHHEDLIDLSMQDWGVDYEYFGLGPFDNYGWAKLTGERLAEDARRNGLTVSVVRPFSGYGEDQSLDYPFPSIVRRARQGDLSVWGPPGQTRDWIHVDDVVRGALAVVASETTDPVNLCTGVATEMGELAQRIYEQARLGPRGMVVAPPYDSPFWEGFPKPTYLEDKPYGAFYRVGDPTRMLQYYQPQVSLEEGIRRALDAQQDL